MQRQRARTQSVTSSPTISVRWLLAAVGLTIVAAAACAWGALCLLFWQGSWQLLYHPASTVARTPASAGLGFDSVGFATTEAGETRLQGWWIPAARDARFNRYTVLYLHGQNGNLGDSVNALATLHTVGLNVLTFDYRGYGQSQFVHPTEGHWREDTEWALRYLTETRHIDSGSIILDGRELGANLALEVAAQHPELAGVILESPLEAPVSAIFNDPRARLVPAHLMVHDRFDAESPAATLRVPSLWTETLPPQKAGSLPKPGFFVKVTAPKMLVWLASYPDEERDRSNAVSRWLDDLPAKPAN